MFYIQTIQNMASVVASMVEWLRVRKPGPYWSLDLRGAGGCGFELRLEHYVWFVHTETNYFCMTTIYG